MRTILVLLALGGLAAAVWFNFGEPAGEAVVPTPSAQQMRAAVGRAVAERTGEPPAIRDFVATAYPDRKRWHVIGTVEPPRVGAPAQTLSAVVATICADFDIPECWSVEDMVIGGRGRLPDLDRRPSPEPGVPSAAAVRETTPLPTPGQAAARLPAELVHSSEGAPAAANTEPATALTEADPAPEPTGASTAETSTANDEAGTSFRTQRPRMNGRAGPGTQFDIVAVVTDQTLLTLIRPDGQWGSFRFQREDGAESTAWFYLPLLTPAAGSDREGR